MPHGFDILTHQDEIYRYYLNKELWIRDLVRRHNQLLIQQNKPKIQLGLFDVLSYDILYGNDNEILLVEHQIQHKKPISKKSVQIPKSIYGIYHMPNAQSRWHRNIERNFNCFINRNDPARQGWFYLLYNRGLLDQSYSSFSCVSRSELSTLSDQEYFDKIHQDTLSSFDNIYDDIKKIVPFKNFKETGNLCDTIMATKFSIVIETYFERTDAITFSEKTFRALQTPRPWLLFHATNSIKILKELGFYVYDDFIDHSYDGFDTTYSFVQRQEGIFSQIRNLLSLNVTSVLLDYWEKKTLENYQILHELNQTWQKDVTQSIEQAYNLAMAQ